MTVLQRYGGWLLLIGGVALAVYGLVDERDVVVLAGALLAAAGIVLDRVRPAPSVSATISAQVRHDIEARIAEHLRQRRN